MSLPASAEDGEGTGLQVRLPLRCSTALPPPLLPPLCLLIFFTEGPGICLLTYLLYSIYVVLGSLFHSEHTFCPSLLYHKTHLPFSTATLQTSTSASYAGTALPAH